MRLNLIIISKICDIRKSKCSYAYSFLLENNLYSANKPDILETSVGLVSSFCHTIRISLFLLPVGYGYLTVLLFWIPFGSIYHVRTFVPSQSHPSIRIQFRMVLTQITTCVYRGGSHLEIPSKYNNLDAIAIFIPTSRFFDTIIDVHN